MPRVLDWVAALLGIVLLSPLLAILAVVIRFTSPGPALHRATRVGPDGTFTLLKLRTMYVGSPAAGTGVTAAEDPWVTRVGSLLRSTKLDELPQLWNVLRGEMALVGPRPEDPRYVDCNDPLHKAVFSARPGITGPTALAYRDEEAILAATALDVAREAGHESVTSADLERAYRERILPVKLAMDLAYLRTRSLRGDFAILARTIAHPFRRLTRR